MVQHQWMPVVRLYVTIRFCDSALIEEKPLVFFRKISLAAAAFLVMAAALTAFGQEPTSTPVTKEDKKPVVTPSPPNAKDAAAKPVTAEQVVETAIAIYGFGGGRNLLNQIRKTTIEKGKTKLTAADGHIDPVNYERWIIRADTLDKERIRLDQEFPNARYSLIRADDKIFGIYNDSVFTPRDDASKTFDNQTFRGIEALLRYKEDGATVALGGRDKIMGVDLYFIDFTDKLGRKTRYYLSSRSFRVMMLEYEDDGVKYKRKFYNYNYAQGTLVPYRSVLWANDKVVEESDISTITFGQKVDEELFKAG